MTARAVPRPASALPSVDRLLGHPTLRDAVARHGHVFVTNAVRAELQARRDATQLGGAPETASDTEIAAAVSSRVAAEMAPRLKQVFNLTGVVLHTNLGRALLAPVAIEAIVRTMDAAVNVEFDLARGERGDRDALVEDLIREITGAEAATVVNNNAAAVLLTVAALAARREVIVSRGELVEIGGAFRMPDVMQSAGAKLVEVGTTNRSHPHDYSAAIGARTALVMKVHTSNYVVQGFAASVGEAELATIAHGAGLPFVVDLGSGSLVDLAHHGLPREPMPQDALARGADVVTFSGDKLLGGPQAGLIVGRADSVSKIRRHPLKRALRVSKLTLAALEATLELYRHPETLAQSLPTLRHLTRRAVDIEASARRIAPGFARAVGSGYVSSVEAMMSQIGSGSLPVDRLPSHGIVARPVGARKGSGRRLDALSAALRGLPIPVVGRIADGALWLDLRTLDDEAAFVRQLASLASAQPAS